MGLFDATTPDFKSLRKYSFNTSMQRARFQDAVRKRFTGRIAIIKTSSAAEHEVCDTPRVLYHVTTPPKAEKILKHGLRPGQPTTLAGPNDLPDVSRRVYLTAHPEIFAEDEAFARGAVILQVTLPANITVYHGSHYDDIIATHYVREPIPPQYIRTIEGGRNEQRERPSV